MRSVVPALIILDFRMPEGSGPAFLAVLQGSPVFQKVPVLIISGYLEDEPPRASLGLNIVARLPEPPRLAEVLGAVETALATPPPP